MQSNVDVGIRVVANAAQGIDALRGMRAQSDQLPGSFNSASVAASNLQRQVVGLVAGFVGIASVAGLGRVADDYSNLSSKLKLATTSSAEYQRANEGVLAISLDTSSSLTANATLYGRVTAALKDSGGTQTEVLQITRSINQALQVSGATSTETASAVLQLSQAFGSGKLAGDEFRAVSEAAPIVLDLLAKSMNVTRGELKQLGSDGEITTEQLRRAFSAENTAGIAAAAANIPNTIGRAMTNATTQFTAFVGKADQVSGASRLVANAIDLISNNLPALAAGISVVAIAMGVQAVASAVRYVTSLGEARLATAANVASLAVLQKAQLAAIPIELAAAKANAVHTAEILKQSIAAEAGAVATGVASTANIAAQTRLAAATAASNGVAVAAAGGLARFGSGLVALAGGPIGLAVAGLALLAAGWYALDAPQTQAAKSITEYVAALRSAEDAKIDGPTRFATALKEQAAELLEIERKRARAYELTSGAAINGSTLQLATGLALLKQTANQQAAYEATNKTIAEGLYLSNNYFKQGVDGLTKLVTGGYGAADAIGAIGTAFDRLLSRTPNVAALSKELLDLDRSLTERLQRAQGLDPVLEGLKAKRAELLALKQDTSALDALILKTQQVTTAEKNATAVKQGVTAAIKEESKEGERLIKVLIDQGTARNAALKIELEQRRVVTSNSAAFTDYLQTQERSLEILRANGPEKERLIRHYNAEEKAIQLINIAEFTNTKTKQVNNEAYQRAIQLKTGVIEVNQEIYDSERKVAEASDAAAKAYEQRWSGAIDGVSSAFGDFFTGQIKSFSDFGNSLKQVAIRFLADMATEFAKTKLVEPFFNALRGIGSGAGNGGGLSGFLGSIFGGSSATPAPAQSGGFLSSIGGLFGFGGSSPAAAPTQSGGFGQILGSIIGFGGGNPLGSSGAGGILGAASGIFGGLGAALGGTIGALGGFSSALTIAGTSGLGAATSIGASSLAAGSLAQGIGALLPVVGIVAGIATLVNSISGGRLFGGKKELTGGGIDINLGPDGASGNNFANFSQRRSIFSGGGTRRTTTNSALDAETQAQVNQLASVSAGIVRVALGNLTTTLPNAITGAYQQLVDKTGKVTSETITVLGVQYKEGLESLPVRVGAENIFAGLTKITAQSLDTFAAQFRGSATSLLDAAQTAAVAQTLIKQGVGLLRTGDLVTTVNLVNELKGEGETLTATLTRVYGSAQQLRQATDLMGVTFNKSEADVVRFAVGIAEAAGGLDEAKNLWDSYFTAFYTAQELGQRELIAAQATAVKELGEIGIDSLIDKEEFRTRFEAALPTLSADDVVQYLEAGRALGIVTDLMGRIGNFEFDPAKLNEFRGFVDGFVKELNDANLSGFQRSVQGINTAVASAVQRANELAIAAGLAGASENDLMAIRESGLRRLKDVAIQLERDITSAASQLYKIEASAESIQLQRLVQATELAGSLRQLGEQRPGQDGLSLAGAFRIPLKEFLADLGVIIGTDSRAIDSLIQASSVLGVEVSQLAAQAGVELGKLSDATSLLNDAFERALQSLGSDQRTAIEALLRDLEGASTDAGRATAQAALEAFINTLPLSVRTSLAPLLEGVDTTSFEDASLGYADITATAARESAKFLSELAAAAKEREKEFRTALEPVVTATTGVTTAVDTAARNQIAQAESRALAAEAAQRETAAALRDVAAALAELRGFTNRPGVFVTP